MEQPEHDLRAHIPTAVESTSTRSVSLIVVGAIHVGLAFALIAGLKSGLIEKLPEELKAEVVQPKDVVKPPPPPPPDLAKPPPPFVPPPDISIASDAPATTAITTQSTVPTPPAPPPQPPAVGTRATPRGSRRSCTDLYRSLSLKLNEEGVTQVRFTITAEGDVTNASITKPSGFDRLDQATLSCIVRWHWTPATNPQGQPMETETALNIQWKVPK
ncbi:MAG TPA: energy transducer TonB [Rhizomicrobium sp.]